MMDVRELRDRLHRRERLDAEWFHLFSLDEMVDALRREEAYRSNGHSGLLLLKSEQLRVVLEVARDGNEIGEHTIPGPTVIQVLEGSLQLETENETRLAHAGEMVVVPHDRPRTLRARDDAAFVWALALES